MTKYIVMEIQTFDTGAVSTPTYAYDAQASAESKFHAILSSAAISKLPKHAAVLMTSEGYVQDSRCYEHEPEPEPEPEPEETEGE
jgi:hypothetical protein